MRILYFLSAVMLVVVLIVGCTGEQPGVVDPVNTTGLVPPPAEGCPIDELCPCDNNWNNHGEYVSCVTHAANECKKAGLITGAQKGAIVAAAAQADCPPTAPNPCDNNLCVNGATCVPEPDDFGNPYTCVCPPGFTGQYCEIDPCAFSLCVNGGTCVRADDGLSSTCDCPPGYTGMYCEIEP